MVSVARLSHFLLRNVRSSLRASVRHYDAESGGEELRSMTATMVNKEDDDYLYVEAYSPIGFRLANNFRIIGPCVLFPRSVLHWGVNSSADINEESLSLFTILEPKLDLLIVGTGDRGAKYDKSIVRFLRSHKMNVEILPTDQACATFNFLNSERRMVAAALIPPLYMEESEEDDDLLIRNQLEQGEDPYTFKEDVFQQQIDKEPGEFEDAVKYMQTKDKKYLKMDQKESESEKVDQESKSEKKTDGKDKGDKSGPDSR